MTRSAETRQRHIHRLQDRLQRYFAQARRTDGTYNFLRIRSFRKYKTQERAWMAMDELAQALDTLIAEEQRERRLWDELAQMKAALQDRQQARLLGQI